MTPQCDDSHAETQSAVRFGIPPQVTAPPRPFYHRWAIGLSSLLCGLIALPALAVDPADWHHWRGPEFNGISREKNLPEKWSPKGENVLWSKPEYATRSTPVVFDGRLYIVSRYKPETTEEGEQLVCLDAETGEVIWEEHHNVYLSDAPAERVGWSSPMVDPNTGKVYWLGLGCQFMCLDGETGEVHWEHSLSEEYGMLSTYGGRTNFPIIYEDLVIVSGIMTQWGAEAVPGHRFIGFDKRTGASVWFSITQKDEKPADTTYSTPFLTVFGGQPAIVFGAGDGFIHAIQPATGKNIWSYKASNRGINTPPLVHEGSVYCGHREQNAANPRQLGAIFAINGEDASGKVAEGDLKWKLEGRSVEGSQPLMVDGRLYVVEDNGNLVVLNPDDGEVIFEKKIGRRPGSIIYGDGKIYACEQSGNFWVIQPTDEGFEILERVRMPTGEELLAAPIISGGRIYVATTKALYCIGDKDRTPEADSIPPRPQEAPVSENPEIAHLQIAPVEAMLKPGQSTPYQVRAYNKLGQYLKVVDDAELSVEGGGAITPDGTYTAPETEEHTPVYITAKVGDQESTARVRVIPTLPWSWDFSDGEVPITWNGANYRHKPTELDGEPVLIKVSTIPKGTRSQSWMGWTNLHDYTIQADFNSTANEDNGRRADMGLINQRYTLDMMNKNLLQIRSWTPRLELRFAKTIPFQWQENTWYTMKFQSENKADSVVLRGKVWKRGEEEPTEWTIEAADAVPNREGSPGMFGNAQTTPFYIDNVQVYPNKN